MPDKPTKQFKHERQLPPGQFVQSSFRTVKVTHAPERKIREGKYPKGTKVVAGKLKKPRRIREKKRGKVQLVEKQYATQSILIPKHPRKAMKRMVE